MNTVDEILEKMDILSEEELNRRIAERITIIPENHAQRDLSSVMNEISDRTLDRVMTILQDYDELLPLGSDIGHLLGWMRDTVDMDNPGDHWAMIVLCKIIGLWGYDIHE